MAWRIPPPPPSQTWLTSLTCRRQHFYREIEIFQSVYAWTKLFSLDTVGYFDNMEL